MKAVAVIDQLREMGFRVEAKGDKLIWKWEGQGNPNTHTYRPLLEELKAHKMEALEALRQQDDNVAGGIHVQAPAATSSNPDPPAVCDPFDPAHQLPAGLIITLPCLDHPDCWIARRIGTLEPEGHGPDQVEAILDLDRREAERGCADG